MKCIWIILFAVFYGCFFSLEKSSQVKKKQEPAKSTQALKQENIKNAEEDLKNRIRKAISKIESGSNEELFKLYDPYSFTCEAAIQSLIGPKAKKEFLSFFGNARVKKDILKDFKARLKQKVNWRIENQVAFFGKEPKAMWVQREGKWYWVPFASGGGVKAPTDSKKNQPFHFPKDCKEFPKLTFKKNGAQELRLESLRKKQKFVLSKIKEGGYHWVLQHGIDPVEMSRLSLTTTLISSKGNYKADSLEDFAGLLQKILGKKSFDNMAYELEQQLTAIPEWRLGDRIAVYPHFKVQRKTGKFCWIFSDGQWRIRLK